MEWRSWNVEPLEEETFAKLRKLAYETTNISLRDGKQILVANRLRKRLLALGLTSYDDYYRYLTCRDEGKEELSRFIDCLSTNETYFYREASHLELMREHIFPELFSRRNEVVLWSAGCSTGEEPYTLRMVFEEGLGRRWQGSLRILATDINTEVIAKARRGRYGERSLRFLPPRLLSTYFAPDGADHYRLSEALASTVEFRVHNLLKQPPPLDSADVIFCRNVMIYFDKETQRRLVDDYFAPVLDPEGYLCVGHSESLAGTSKRFRFIRGMGAPLYRPKIAGEEG